MSVVLFSAGCSGSSAPEPEAKEIKASEVKTLETSEPELFKASKKLYQSGLYSIARESFEALRDSYPFGPYSQFAEIKVGDCYYELSDFVNSSQQYDNFLKNHPTSDAAPYVLMRAGLSQRFINKGMGRDSGSLEKSKQYFDSFLEKYPESVYYPTVKQYRDEVVKELDGYERLVADYYKRKGNMEAYNARTSHAEEKWGTIVASLANAPTEEPALEPEEGSAVDLSNIPEAAFAEEYELPAAESAAGTAVAAAETEPKGRPAAKTSPAPATAKSKYRVESVECKNDQSKMVVVYLDRVIEDGAFVKAHADVAPIKGEIALKLPETRARPLVNDCFAGADLTISESAELKLKTEQRASLLSVDHPPRLLLIMR